MRVSIGWYYIIFYTDRFISKPEYGGTSYGPVAFIRPARYGDKGLFVHELTHIKQWYRYFGLSHVFMSTVEREIEAYRSQINQNLKDGNWTREYLADYYAQFLIDNYDLDRKYTRVELYQRLVA